MSTENAIPFMKADALVSIQVGADFTARLTTVLNYLSEGRSEDELNAFKKKVQEKGKLEGWEESFLTLSVLVAEIHKQADSTGQVVYRSLSDTE